MWFLGHQFIRHYLPLFLQVNMAQPAEAIHNWIRGHDKVPGAWVVIDGKVRFLNTQFVCMILKQSTIGSAL